MKKWIAAGCIATLFSCSNTNEFDAELDAKVSKQGNTGQQVNPTASPMPVNNQPVSSQPIVTTTPPPATATATEVSQQPAKTAKGMNPPHGQPGHRCDIAVGAPLNAPPNTAGKNGQTITVNPTSATTTKTAKGMNPPHGQPGHRCDIAVGAPLNAAPAKAGETTQIINNKAEETKPAAADPWKADVKPAKKDSSSH